VPITVAITDEHAASISVLRSAVKVAGEENSSAYHLNEKPVKVPVLFDALNEKNTSTSIGI
jgi:hypothetical protein